MEILGTVFSAVLTSKILKGAIKDSVVRKCISAPAGAVVFQIFALVILLMTGKVISSPDYMQKLAATGISFAILLFID
jgi:hypothetical protein